MAGFTPIDRNNLLAGKPFTSPIALAYDENLEAVAEGAPGAWRIDARANAFSTYMEHSVGGNGDTSEWTGLDTLAIANVFHSWRVRNNLSVVVNVQSRIRGSADGGATWGSWLNFPLVQAPGTGALTVAMYDLIVNLATGDVGLSGQDNTTLDLGVTSINALQIQVPTLSLGSGGTVSQSAHGFLHCRAEDT